MILELDLGNTRCKWRLVDGDTVLQRGNEVLQALPNSVPKAGRIRIASVLAPAKEQWIAAELAATLGVVPEFAQSDGVCAGVRNAYQHPHTLGVDRWLGMLAAFSLTGGAALVVSAGTAVTIDELDGGGVHLGGYILPGPQLMLDALRGGTDKVRFADAPWRMEAGRETGQCVAAGVALALVGAIRVARRDGVPVIVTGGYGGHLVDELAGYGIPATLVPELVLDGLKLALP